MTRELLKRYQDILAEIESLTAISADSVKASLPDFPYTLHTVQLEASDDFIRPTPTKLDKLAKLRAERREIENWIDRLPRFKLRRIAWMYANSYSWAEIAAKIKDETPSSARVKLMRAIKTVK